MEWKKAWKELPSKDGVYLCALENHYGIFEFSDGKFHANDWGDYCGLSFESSYIGGENCITFWCELPEWVQLSEDDLKELKEFKKKKKLTKKT